MQPEHIEITNCRCAYYLHFAFLASFAVRDFVHRRERKVRKDELSQNVQFLTINSAEDLCRYFTTEMAKALKSNGADNIKKLHVRVDEGIGQGAGCEYEL